MRNSLVISLLVAPLALLAAGCGGGSSSPGVASVSASTTTSTSGQIGLVAFSHCMRAHGVSTFPDPNGAEGIPKTAVIAASKRNPHKYNTAANACGHLLPNGSMAPPQSAQQQRTQLADELSFAHCMRSRGVSGFPDPSASQGLSVAAVEAAGIDVHSPQVLRVVQKCLPASHGGLTAAKVREALSNNP